MTVMREDLSSDCYYKNLGLSKNASDSEIKSAYRKLALKYHPDKNKDNPDKAAEDFKKVSEAYDCLSDKNKRDIYDSYANGGFGDDFGGFGGFHFGGDGGFGGQHGRPRQRKAPPQYPSGPHIIPKDTSVSVHSLQSSAQYNGMEGKLVGYDTNKGRYKVSFGDDDSAISIKPSNFVQLVPHVRVRDIASRPTLNGCSGAVVGFNGDRFHVRLAGARTNGAVVGVSLANLELPPETRVHIHSLNGAPQYNGTTGRVVKFLEADNRYLVEVVGNKQLKLKSENIMI